MKIKFLVLMLIAVFTFGCEPEEQEDAVFTLMSMWVKNLEVDWEEYDADGNITSTYTSTIKFETYIQDREKISFTADNGYYRMEWDDIDEGVSSSFGWLDVQVDKDSPISQAYFEFGFGTEYNPEYTSTTAKAFVIAGSVPRSQTIKTVNGIVYQIEGIACCDRLSEVGYKTEGFHPINPDLIYMKAQIVAFRCTEDTEIELFFYE